MRVAKVIVSEKRTPLKGLVLCEKRGGAVNLLLHSLFFILMEEGE